MITASEPTNQEPVGVVDVHLKWTGSIAGRCFNDGSASVKDSIKSLKEQKQTLRHIPIDFPVVDHYIASEDSERVERSQHRKPPSFSASSFELVVQSLDENKSGYLRHRDILQILTGFLLDHYLAKLLLSRAAESEENSVEITNIIGIVQSIDRNSVVYPAIGDSVLISAYVCFYKELDVTASVIIQDIALCNKGKPTVNVSRNTLRGLVMR